jgi:hypothetical protein
MPELSYAIAWLLPLLVGAGLGVMLRGGAGARGDAAAIAGAGWIVGLFACAGLVRVVAADDVARAFEHAAPWAFAAGVGALAVATFAARRARARTPALRRHAGAPLDAASVLWWLAAALVATRVLWIGAEAALRPVFPWDAWTAWEIKAKTWFLLGHVEPYVPIAEWLQDAVAATRTATAGRYPELLAWIQLWFASAAGAWNEPLVHLAWCGALAAFALAAYGYWRVCGLAPWPALALVYALVSLPLLNAHVALAGYADLWIAVTFGLALLAWTRWLLRREPGQWLLAVAVALCLPAIKLEGAVWLLAFLAVAAIDLIPRSWRWRIAGAAFVLAAVALVIGRLIVPTLGLGLVYVTLDDIAVPAIGTYGLHWRASGTAMLASLFTLPNWHLLWYLLPVLVFLRRHRFAVDHAARMLGLLVLIEFAFLFVLFFLTDAAQWAQDYTSANRLILQIVPGVFVLAAVLLRPLPRAGVEAGSARGGIIGR